MKFCENIFRENLKVPVKKIYEISFNILKIFENQKVLKLSEYFWLQKIKWYM